MLHKIISGAAAVALTAAALVATSSAAEARRARPSPAAPASVSVGESFAITVRPHRRGVVKLQRRTGTGSWHTVARTRSRRAAARLTFPRTEGTAGRVAYRARIAGRSSRADVVTVRPRAGSGSPGTTPPPPRPALYVQVSSGSEDDILVDDTYTVGVAAVAADGSPIVGLAVTVQKQDPGATTWTPVGGALTTDSAGEASFPDSTGKRGLVTYRATGGALSGETLAVIWQDVPMPSAPGNGLSVTGRCGAGVAPSGVDVDMTLTSSATCHVAVNDVLTLTWSFGGNGCTPVGYDDFTFTGSKPESIVDVSVLVDGTETSDAPATLSDGGSTGGLHLHGDPMSQLRLTMKVRAGSDGSFRGRIAAPLAHCF